MWGDTHGGDTQWEGEGHMIMGQEHLEGDNRHIYHSPTSLSS